MKRMISLSLAGMMLSGIMILTSRAAVDPSVLEQFEHPDRDRAALQKLRDTLWPEAQEANPIALKIVENALRALDQDREDDELPFTMPKKLSDAAAKAWKAPVRKKAEAGDMFFACVLGSMYLKGSGIEKDEPKGLVRLEKAAAAQSALAHSWLGDAYAKGLGCPVDYFKAIEYYLQAGKLGLAAGWNNAGWHQSEYHLLGPEFPSPRECYEKAMAMNYPRACYNLGRLYLKGEGGVVLDKAKGLSLIREAAKKNFPQAKQHLAEGYIIRFDKKGDDPLFFGCALLQPPAGKKGIGHGHLSNDPSDPMAKEMHEAVLKDDLPAIEALLAKGAKIDARAPGRLQTPLQTAAEKGRMEIAQFLVSKKADLTVTDRHGETPLDCAIKAKSLDIVKLLLDNKCEVSGEAFMNAFRQGAINIVKLLVERDRDKTFYVGDEESTTVMHAAVVYNQLGILHQALQKGGDPNARNDFGYTPLQLAVIYDRKLIIEYLLEQGARLDALSAALSGNPDLLQEMLEADPDQVDSRDERGMTPLHLAARRRLLKNVELLLDFGADPNARNIFDEAPLHTVIYSVKDLFEKPEDTMRAIVDKLLAYGADINAKDKVAQQESGTGSGTPLIAAIRALRDSLTTKLLIERGADVNARNAKGVPALYLAASRSADLALTLIDRGANVNYYSDKDGSLLHAAIFSDNERLIEALLARGVDINAKNKEGMTALEYAGKMKKVRAISSVYQKHGIAVPDAIRSVPPSLNPLIWCIESRSFEGKHYSEKTLIEQIERGMTNYQQLINIPNRIHFVTLPLDAAVSLERHEIAKWLIKKGADVNGRTPYGSTALYSAVEYGRIRMVKLLLENKADPNAKVEGVSPLQEARKKGYTEIIKLLLAYGATE